MGTDSQAAQCVQASRVSQQSRRDQTHKPPPAAVQAPGGYAARGLTSPPLTAELDTPFISIQRARSSSSSSKHKKQQTPDKQQQPQQQPPQLVSAHSVVYIKPDAGPCCPDHTSKQEVEPCCSCTLGWVLYGLGWLLPLCWVAAIILPFFTKKRTDKRAAVASAVTLGLLVLIGVVVAVAFVATARQAG